MIRPLALIGLSAVIVVGVYSASTSGLTASLISNTIHLNATESTPSPTSIPATPAPTPTPVNGGDSLKVVPPADATPIKLVVESEPEVGPIIRIQSNSEIKLPLDDFRPTLAQLTKRNLVWARLEQDCMRRFGLEGILGKKFSEPRQSILPIFLSQDSARRIGYSDEIPRTAGPDALTTPGREEINGTDGQAATQIYTGTIASYKGQSVPAGGCSKEARDKIIPGTDNIKVDASDLAFAAGFRAQSDSRVVAVTQQWSVCMKERGFTFWSPQHAQFTGLRKAEEEAKGEEIAIATADADCRAKTNLTGINLAVEAAYQKVAIVQFRNVALAAKEQHSRTMSRVAGLS
ncbi:hypothetical protein ACIBF6_44975 [Streptosporangium amethystogenes]|uniref:hypothetical protein n=1 Tax=Streptosporangium amethystogenes TaxID=2002 RepID=UPI0037A9341D